MMEFAKIIVEAIVALAVSYLALAFRAFRAEMRLEIRTSVDGALKDVFKELKEYVRRELCDARHGPTLEWPVGRPAAVRKAE